MDAGSVKPEVVLSAGPALGPGEQGVHIIYVPDEIVLADLHGTVVGPPPIATATLKMVEKHIGRAVAPDPRGRWPRRTSRNTRSRSGWKGATSIRTCSATATELPRRDGGDHFDLEQQLGPDEPLHLDEGARRRRVLEIARAHVAD